MTLSNWDDLVYVTENIHIRTLNFQSLTWMFTSFEASNWHPVTWLSHSLDITFFGLNPTWHHFTSIIHHVLNTLLVFLLTHKLFSQAPSDPEIHSKHSLITETTIASVLTALLFGIHPLHVESVAWVAERKDLLCTFFFPVSVFFSW